MSTSTIPHIQAMTKHFAQVCKRVQNIRHSNIQDFRYMGTSNLHASPWGMIEHVLDESINFNVLSRTQMTIASQSRGGQLISSEYVPDHPNLHCFNPDHFDLRYYRYGIFGVGQNLTIGIQNVETRCRIFRDERTFGTSIQYGITFGSGRFKEFHVNLFRSPQLESLRLQDEGEVYILEWKFD
jgi:hypothetical protein